MRLDKCAEAYIALTVLSRKELPFDTAWAISRVMRELKGEFECFSQKELELMAEFAEKDENGKTLQNGGQFQIQAGREEEYLKKREELCSLDISYGLPAMTVPAPYTITAQMIDTLDGFLIFEKGE